LAATVKVAVAGAVTVWLCGWVEIDGGVLEGEGGGPGMGEGGGDEAIELELPQPDNSGRIVKTRKTQATGDIR
jgi:hypothetical protein